MGQGDVIVRYIQSGSAVSSLASFLRTFQLFIMKSIGLTSAHRLATRIEAKTALRRGEMQVSDSP
jgi:hypothetical protein